MCNFEKKWIYEQFRIVDIDSYYTTGTADND